MTDRRTRPFPGGAEPADITRTDIAALPEPERSVVETDLLRVRGWLREHPDVRASLALDRTAFDAGQGHVLMIITLSGDPTELRPHLESAVLHPDRLRVRVARPSLEELCEVLQWVVATRMTSDTHTTVTTAGIDERAGEVVVTLNRRDEDNAAELVALAGGLLRVEPEPVIPKPLGSSDSGLAPSASSRAEKPETPAQAQSERAASFSNPGEH